MQHGEKPDRRREQPLGMDVVLGNHLDAQVRVVHEREQQQDQLPHVEPKGTLGALDVLEGHDEEPAEDDASDRQHEEIQQLLQATHGIPLTCIRLVPIT